MRESKNPAFMIASASWVKKNESEDSQRVECWQKLQEGSKESSVRETKLRFFYATRQRDATTSHIRDERNQRAILRFSFPFSLPLALRIYFRTARSFHPRLLPSWLRFLSLSSRSFPCSLPRIAPTRSKTRVVNWTHERDEADRTGRSVSIARLRGQKSNGHLSASTRWKKSPTTFRFVQKGIPECSGNRANSANRTQKLSLRSGHSGFIRFFFRATRVSFLRATWSQNVWSTVHFTPCKDERYRTEFPLRLLYYGFSTLANTCKIGCKM